MASQTYNNPSLSAAQHALSPQQRQQQYQEYPNYTHPSLLQQRQESPQRPQLAQQHSRQESSSSSARKVTTTNLHETSAEKESKRLHTKADPTVAMQEAEPGAEFRNKERSLPHMREIDWKEPDGKPVEHPDRSNPSRSKYERPLETIRKLEAAIDGGYNNRQSIYRADSDSVANFNRRSGYYGSVSGYNGASTPRFPQDSYYGGRPMSTSRPDSAMFDPRSSAMLSGPPGGNPRDSYFDGYESAAYGYGGGFSGGGGSSSGRNSENSSIDRRMPARRQEPVNDYGISFGQSPSYQPPSLGVPASQPRTMPSESVPVGVPMPTKQSGGGGLLRKSSSKMAAGTQQRPEAGDKRKSWFSRRFSKNS